MMTNVLLGDYPDVFKAGAAFSGVPATCFATTPPNEWNSVLRPEHLTAHTARCGSTRGPTRTRRARIIEHAVVGARQLDELTAIPGS
jgi:hypothetical protein